MVRVEEEEEKGEDIEEEELVMCVYNKHRNHCYHICLIEFVHMLTQIVARLSMFVLDNKYFHTLLAGGEKGGGAAGRGGGGEGGGGGGEGGGGGGGGWGGGGGG